MKFKLAALTSHPIQYQAPLFRKLSARQDIDLTVYFCWDFGVKEATLDPGFGVKLKWDIPLLEGYKYKFLPNLSPIPSSSFFGLINPSIIKEMSRYRYDAIWVHGYATFSNCLAFLGARTSKTPILFRGESHLLNHRPGWKKIIKKIMLTALFRRISSFLTIGSLNSEYYRYYKVADDRMFLTPYAVDNDFFSDKNKTLRDKRKVLKQSLGISSEIPVILYASKMIPRKRAMDLLRAYEQIQNQVNAALVFVGDGSERSVLEMYTEKNRLRNVHFTGFKNQTELPEYFALADVFVLPSTDEPWGLIINEAMNFGLPIITTDTVGAAPDLVRHGENGFIYTAGDFNKLSECILKILNAPELKIRMGICSLDIIKKWSFNEDIDGILSALKYVQRVYQK